MPNRFASGKWAISQCDRCNFRYPLKELKIIIIKTKNTNIKVCKTCWEPDQPQLQLGMYPVDDPQAVRDPRPDITYFEGGLNGVQVFTVSPPDPESDQSFGVPTQGSRVIQWGWKPVGLNNPLGLPSLPDVLQATGAVGTVTVEIG